MEKSWKSLVPEICVKMFLANRIAGFFKWIISLEQKDEKVWFFACWYKFIEIKSWAKNIEMGGFINGCAHSGCRNLKLIVSHKEINRINPFLVIWYKFRKAKSYFNNWTLVLQRVLKNHGCLSVLPSVCPSNLQFSIFISNGILVIFWFMARL